MKPSEFNPNERAYPFDDHPSPYISVTPRSVTFTGQTGPIKEVGENGCQIDELIQFARDTIGVFNEKFSCRENSIVLTKLDEALLWLGKRKADREARGVEGTSAE
jgi:hypothetical protein